MYNLSNYRKDYAYVQLLYCQVLNRFKLTYKIKNCRIYGQRKALQQVK